MTASLLVVTGPPGAGKSTVARLVSQRLDSSVLVEGDAFFGFMDQGAIAPWLAEADAQNEIVVGAVEDAASLTCPIESLRWLAGRLAQLGLQLCKGQVILTGSPMNLFPVAPGSRIVVEAPPLGASCAEIDP